MEQIKKQECIELIKMIYRHHAAGGCMHIVLDDDNTEDHYVDVCVRYIKETVDNDDWRNAWFHCIEMACAMLLTEMEEGERIEVIKQAWKEMRDGADWERALNYEIERWNRRAEDETDC